MQQPGHDRDHPADCEPFGAKETSGAAERMPRPNRRRKHRPTVLEQEGDVGGQRRSEREKQSEDHEPSDRVPGWPRLATVLVAGAFQTPSSMTTSRSRSTISERAKHRAYS